jgi:hypothetical protein
MHSCMFLLKPHFYLVPFKAYINDTGDKIIIILLVFHFIKKRVFFASNLAHSESLIYTCVSSYLVITS